MTMEAHIILYTILLFGSLTLGDRSYRSDYIYNRKTDAFYKFHTDPSTNAEAIDICETEGSTLMLVSSDRDLEQIHGMLKQFPDIEDQVWIGNDGLEHEPGDELLVVDLDDARFPSTQPWGQCEAITRNGDIETFHCYLKFPFICKVEGKDAFYNSQCGVYGKDYEYFSEVGSCYRIPSETYSWDQAYDDCEAQGSHLVVINSKLEQRVIRNFTRLHSRVTFESVPWFYFAGIRAEKTVDGSPRVFKTIFGQTLKEAGFDEWSGKEPNNAFGREYCGSIFQGDGKYNDLDCTHLYRYICEKEVKSK